MFSSQPCKIKLLETTKHFCNGISVIWFSTSQIVLCEFFHMMNVSHSNISSSLHCLSFLSFVSLVRFQNRKVTFNMQEKLLLDLTNLIQQPGKFLLVDLFSTIKQFPLKPCSISCICSVKFTCMQYFQLFCSLPQPVVLSFEGKLSSYYAVQAVLAQCVHYFTARPHLMLFQ